VTVARPATAPARIPQPASLYEAVEWKQWLWYPPIRWVIGNPERFRNRTLLEIGPGRGLMCCYFASLGAHVTAADCSQEFLDATTVATTAMGFPVTCLLFSGDYADLPSGFDFVFTKSSLVMTGKAAIRAAQIPRLLRPGGEYIGVENLTGGYLTRFYRRIKHTSPTFPARFSPITDEVKQAIGEGFKTVKFRHVLGWVLAIRATVE